MGMAEYEKALPLLKKAERNDDFYPHTPCSEAEIQAVEKELKVLFPPTFRRFLNEFGAADIFNFRILGMPEIVSETLKAKEKGYIKPSHVLLISSDELGDPICFDYSDPALAEAPIVRYRYVEDDQQTISSDFGGYLLHVLEYYGDLVPEPVGPAPDFDPPFGYEKRNGQLVPHRKEIKVAGLIVQRHSYDGVSWKAIAKEFNERKIPMRDGKPWTMEALMAVHAEWKEKY